MGLAVHAQGAWAASPCPNCGGDDRFVFKPGDPKGPWFCRGCGLRGDAIDFLRTFEGMAFAEARALVVGEAASLPDREYRATSVDRDLWQSTVAPFVARAQRYLDRAASAREYVLTERGIRPDTAAALGIGFVPQPFLFKRTELGLDRNAPGPEYRDVCFPAGIVVPIREGGELVGVQVRRVHAETGQGRYYTLAGSMLRPLVCPGASEETVIIVESFLCAALVWQETAGRCAVAGIGSAGARQLGDAASLITAADLVLVALDTDVAGAENAHAHWGGLPNARRWPIPSTFGKDPTDACRRGLDLDAWVRAAFEPGDCETALEWLAEPQSQQSRLVSYGGRDYKVALVEDRAAAQTALAQAALSKSASLTFGEGEDGCGWVALFDRARAAVSVIDLNAVSADFLSGPWPRQVIVHGGEDALRRLPGLLTARCILSCTRLMANALYNDRPDLEEALRREGVPPLPRAFSGWERLALRAIALPRLQRALHDRLRDEERLGLYHILRDAQRPVAAMEASGLPFDAVGYAALVRTWRVELDGLRAMLPDGFEPRRGEDVRQWLANVLPQHELDAWPRRSDGRLGIGDANLAAATGIAHAETIRACRRLEHRLSTYGERFSAYVDRGDGRLHGTWAIGGAATGRFACQEPNLLALPRDPAFRALVRPKEGRLLLVADISQAQLRIAAHIAGDRAMLAAYESGDDLHATTAAALAGIDTAAVTSEQRQAAKAANFGLLFGQSAEGFRRYAAQQFALALSPAEASATRRGWLSRFRGIADWHDATARALAQGQAVETIAGRAAPPEAFERNPLQQALAFQVQGTEAEIVLRAIALLHARLRRLDARLVLVVHDELLVEADDDAATVAAAAEAIGESVTAAFREFFPGAAVAGLVEVYTGGNWADTG
jgi:DNA polymerase-1